MAAGAALATVVALLVATAPAASAAEQPDSLGKEYWLAFPRNYNSAPALTLFITGPTATSGTVTIPGLSFSSPFTVTPGSITSVTLPSSAELSSQQVVQNLGVHVVADAEVTVYGLNRIQYTTDAYLGLPVDVLDTEHIVLATPPTYGSSEFAVVAAHDGTSVTVTPSTGTDAGSPAGTPIVVSLNAGEAYPVESSSGDLTGSVISSDKPVAVFGGNSCANVPDIYTTACDHVVEQLPGVSTWGSSFLSVPLKTRQNGDTFRVLASQDGTVVKVNGTTVATLARGQVHQQIIDGAAQITSDKPILVAQLSNGSSYDNVVSDPFMMLIPPTEQFLGSYTVSTPATGFPNNYINVVVPTAAIGSVQLDGAPVPGSSFNPIGATGFSGAQLDVAVGSHTVDASAPLGVHAYGFASYDSYGYPGGASYAPVSLVTSLTLTPATQTKAVGEQACLTSTVEDQNGQPLEGVRVDITRTGANGGSGFGFTSSAGTFEYCYVGAAQGADTITAAVGNLSDSAEVIWEAVGNNPPEASAGGPYSGTEGSPVNLSGSGTDADNDDLALTWNYSIVTADPGTSCSFGTPHMEGTTFTCTDDGTFEVTLTADDGTDATTSSAATVTLTNEAPAITSLTPSVTEPMSINTSVELTAPFTDPGSNDTHTCAVDWGDGTSAGTVSAGTCSATHSYTAAGIYAVKLSVTDDDGDSDTATYQYVVVYDPSAGFVTGGGWINSPVGAYAEDPSLEGRADFGFVSKYKKGQTVPDGQTQFQFHAAGLNFHSTSYDWLVVAGPKAQYKGSGTVNGTGDYGFMLTANDGQRAGGGGVDKLRLKIWDKATGTVIYDNQSGDGDDAAATSAVAGGSIVIHK